MLLMLNTFSFCFACHSSFSLAVLSWFKNLEVIQFSFIFII